MTIDQKDELMPTVTGLYSRRPYSEAQILDGRVYPQMKAEPLANEDGALVVPVRNKNRPHFRRLGDASFRTRVGTTENDPTHKKVVSWLRGTLQENKLKIITKVFDDETPRASGEGANYEEQVIFLLEEPARYRWFTESECRVAFDGGSYIEPDIAGRDTTVFFPRVGHESVIIEVIQTHYPDFGTFFRLLSLSSLGHIVVLYFVAPDQLDSRYNRYRIDDKVATMELRPAYYLAQGHVFKNGREWIRRAGQSDKDWYAYLETSYFRVAMEGKKDKAYQ
ncbi:hypothetical protein [Aquitalea sp.]|uniref:hypothetical protein n=1 Tax=Aquitalea sp. TaxID=1872623 RepID=UPI0025905DCF|nr:hypothetical protein [Aquitalea sp.]